MDILTENQFERVRGKRSQLGACLNITSADEHVPEIEQCIRKIKESLVAKTTRLWSPASAGTKEAKQLQQPEIKGGLWKPCNVYTISQKQSSEGGWRKGGRCCSH